MQALFTTNGFSVCLELIDTHNALGEVEGFYWGQQLADCSIGVMENFQSVFHM